MKILRSLQDISQSCKQGVIAIGNFDGVHIGHRYLLTYLVALARDVSVPAIVLTFEPHPHIVLGVSDPQLLLTTPFQKQKQIALCSVKYYLALPCDKKLLTMEYQDFFRVILKESFEARAIIVGEDFRFGRGRKGDAKMLVELCQEYGMVGHVLERMVQEGEGVSSSLVRQKLRDGQLSQANKILGRHYEMQGTITEVKQDRNAWTFLWMQPLPYSIQIASSRVYTGMLRRAEQDLVKVWVRRQSSDIEIVTNERIDLSALRGQSVDLVYQQQIDGKAVFRWPVSS